MACHRANWMTNCYPEQDSAGKITYLGQSESLYFVIRGVYGVLATRGHSNRVRPRNWSDETAVS